MNCWKFIVTFLVIHQVIPSIGQKIDGVYVGSIITKSNALVIFTRAEVVNGNVYLTEYEKFPFFGTFNLNVLNGTIVVSNGNELLVVGKLVGDSLFLDLSSIVESTLASRSVLKRISSNPGYGLSRLFAKRESDRDTLLVGRWLVIKNIDKKGMDSGRKYEFEYRKDGEIEMDKQEIKSFFDDAARKAGTKSISQQSVNRYMPEAKWSTSGDQLVITIGTTEKTYTYSIKADTLTLDGGKFVSIRKRKK